MFVGATGTSDRAIAVGTGVLFVQAIYDNAQRVFAMSGQRGSKKPSTPINKPY